MHPDYPGLIEQLKKVRGIMLIHTKVQWKQITDTHIRMLLVGF